MALPTHGNLVKDARTASMNSFKVVIRLRPLNKREEGCGGGWLIDGQHIQEAAAIADTGDSRRGGKKRKSSTSSALSASASSAPRHTFDDVRPLHSPRFPPPAPAQRLHRWPGMPPSPRRACYPRQHPTTPFSSRVFPNRGCFTRRTLRLFPIRPLTNPRALHPRAPHPITRQVFDGSKSTEDVYNTVGKPLVDSVIQGIHGTLFAYGQTGSGKTFSMTGQRAEAKRGRSQKEVPGIVQLAANDLFAHIRNTASSGGAGKESKEDAEEDLEKDVEDAEEGKEEAVKAIGGSATDGDTVSFKVVASFVEIYNENIRVRFLPLPRPHHTGARTPPYSLGSRSPVLGPRAHRQCLVLETAASTRVCRA